MDRRLPSTQTRVESAVASIVSAARTAEKPVGFYCNSGKEARQRVAAGCLMVSVGIDLGAVTRGLTRELQAGRQTDR